MTLTRKAPMKRGRRKPRARGVYCVGPEGKRCPRKRYPDQTVCVIHYADRLAREFVKARDGKCVRCGATEALQWAHIIGRSYKLVRWNPLNAVTFCQACHMWQTHNPLEGEQFFRDHIGDDTFDALRVEALRTDIKPNPIEWIERFEEAA